MLGTLFGAQDDNRIDCHFAGVRTPSRSFRKKFAKNHRNQVGIALIVSGEMVADLWAGRVDPARTRTWTPDTIVTIRSSTNGILGTWFAVVIYRRLSSCENNVCEYWPEFAPSGKKEITIDMLLSHEAGLSGFIEPASVDELLYGTAVSEWLAQQPRQSMPGTVSSCYGMTLAVQWSRYTINVNAIASGCFPFGDDGYDDRVHGRVHLSLPTQSHGPPAAIRLSPSLSGVPAK
ncbi:serine hydrolase domain-containing protein [Paraburkholderia elongata]|nr:serine hydrolase domain-containing protein [Paraburkholderia elongata]